MVRPNSQQQHGGPTISLTPPPSRFNSKDQSIRARVTFTSTDHPTTTNQNQTNQLSSSSPSSSNNLLNYGQNDPSSPNHPNVISPLQSPSVLSDSEEPNRAGRVRSSSLLSVHQVQDNYDDQLDQGVGPNLNADWVDHKGAWIIHLVLIIFGKILVDIIPGITQDVSWTTVNICYDLITYVMFHYVTGTPFESSGGVYDRLTMWEQIDMGAHYTPTKKWLTILPVALFLLCTHYTRLDIYPFLFALNFSSTLCLTLLPKLPIFHRLRFRFFEGLIGWSNSITDEKSGPPTPIEEQMRRVSVKDLDELSEFGRSSLSPDQSFDSEK
ncbi:ORMDL family-domain-containing protein [Phakopsora pachyrhizi]|uniref:ORMDL family-domain-containing protein n=1 Tax=Phakopsora pachyrhizi TaxID=170000 RepID=A0AAV0BQ05_PHAPC|nr:ORMDL family-domain-containing protein [Phakopsora pachyrhizi]CAH7688727.1 ORMDL family-domain-containing protein [Phakopsora pachyrhizi]